MRKNKLLKIFIAIVLLISIGTSAIAASTGVVNTDTVRVREKPAAKNSKIVGLVSIGDKVTIIGEENGWYKVKAEDDHGEKIEGYIRKDLLTVDGETTEVSTTVDDNEDSSNGGQATENNNSVDENTNPAEEPNNNGDVETSGEVTNGENEGTTTDEPNEGNNSVAVEVGDKTISTIKIAGGVSAGKKVQLTEETKIKILPSANSTNITSLSANTEVTILEVINSWCRVETTEGECGWVRIDQ